MPTYVVRFTVGQTDTDFLRPAASTDATNLFAYGVSEVPPVERLGRWAYPGLDGQFVKKLGGAPRRVRQTGHVEGSSAANLATAKGTVNALVVDQAGGTLAVHDGTESFANMIATGLRWTHHFRAGGRYCAAYELAWEETGG